MLNWCLSVSCCQRVEPSGASTRANSLRAASARFAPRHISKSLKATVLATLSSFARKSIGRQVHKSTRTAAARVFQVGVGGVRSSIGPD